jgi:hypothetical protein
MNCCGHHGVSIPNPDAATLAESAGDTTANGDAWDRIWYRSRYISFGVGLETNKGEFLLSQCIDELFEVFLNCRPEYTAKRDLNTVSAMV